MGIVFVKPVVISVGNMLNEGKDKSSKSNDGIHQRDTNHEIRKSKVFIGDFD